MRLLFNMMFSVFNSQMSDSNVGGRKKQSGINHILVMNNIIYDQVSSVKKVPVLIQKYDYKQMFDGMDSTEASGDLFNYGVDDDLNYYSRSKYRSCDNCENSTRNK